MSFGEFSNIIEEHLIANILNNPLNNPKFWKGERAREKWAKPISSDDVLYIDDYNNKCGNEFKKIANIKLDISQKRQSTLTVDILDESWNDKKEHIYIITRNDVIMKIGGTRDGMKGRWCSYGCGYYVPERCKKDGTSYPGKMSVTNAYLYHTIEKDMLEKKSRWSFWSWELPVIKLPVTILEEQVEVIAQTFHAYESICIKKFKKITGSIPQLCDNSDPDY